MSASSSKTDDHLQTASLRFSKYSKIVPSLTSGRVLCFSGLSGQIIELLLTDLHQLRSATSYSGQRLPERLFSVVRSLLDAQILVHEGGCETTRLLESIAKRRETRKFITLTIAPTLSCNQRCSYCFEATDCKPVGGILKDVSQAILGIVWRGASSSCPVSVTWFGGEPMLAQDSIFEIQSEINRICAERGAPVTRSIITNGTLLGEDAVSMLKDLGTWSMVQVTIDGCMTTHNRRRPFAGGRSSFGPVVRNVSRAVRAGLPIALRMNIDRSNLGEMEELVGFLRDVGIIPGASLYIGHTYDYTEACSHVVDEKLDFQEYHLHYLKMCSLLLQNGVPSGFRIGIPISSRCQADNDDSYVIAPDGSVFRCWNEVHMGPDFAVGNVLDEGGGAAKRRKPAWIGSVLEIEGECLDCFAFPMCLSGCPYISGTKRVKQCRIVKSFPEEAINLQYHESGLLRAQRARKEADAVPPGDAASPAGS